MYFRRMASAADDVLGSGAAGCLASVFCPPTSGTSKTVVPSGMSDGVSGSDGPSSVPSSRAASCSDSSSVASAVVAGSSDGSGLGGAVLGMGVFAPPLSDLESPLVEVAGSSLIWKTSGPTTSLSPSLSSTSPDTCWSLTNVPLVLSKSCTNTWPPFTSTAQCRLLTAGLEGRNWQPSSRPITNWATGIGMAFPLWTPSATTKLSFIKNLDAVITGSGSLQDRIAL